MKLNKSHTCILLFTFLIAFSCNNPSGTPPDVSHISFDMKTYRFDQDFSSIDTNHIGASLQALEAKYPDFLNYYLDTFFTFGIHRNFAETNPILDSEVKPLIVYKDFAQLQRTINQTYPNTKTTDSALKNGFRYMKYYFPEFQVPRVIYMSMFLSKWPAFPLDTTTMCVGLDWFLGEDFPHYANVGVPPYVAAHLRPSYIPVAVFSSLFKAKYKFPPYDKQLLDLMIHHGKEQYFLHKILPTTPDSVLFGYAQHKLDWCAKNEAVIYNFFVHQNLLYNKEQQSIMPYVHDGPFAVNFPDEDPQSNTPGNIGTWLGYRIVTAYMAQNPSITLKQLMEQPINGAQFLEGAKYRPK